MGALDFCISYREHIPDLSIMKCIYLLSVLCSFLAVDAINPYVGLMRNSGRYGSNTRPWDSSSNLINRNTPETDLSWLKDPADDGRKPCVGLCYTLKLMKMAEENKQKRFDGYLYDFYRK